MATNPEEENTGEGFFEAFPGFIRESITGNPRGEVRSAILIIVAALCLVMTPLPFAAIGLLALMLLAVGL